MSNIKFLILATEGLTTDLLCEELAKHGTIEAIILEEREPALKKIRRRFKKLPFFHVLGQLAFLIFLMPILSMRSKRRIKQLVESGGYKIQNGFAEKKHLVKSVNDAAVVAIISQFRPDFVFVNGTRIIRKQILEQIDVPVLNIHVGITPSYRGIHGGYWALYNNDRAHFGVTLHHVDAGVDTGRIIAQQVVVPTNEDSFGTYPVLQFLEGLKLVQEYFARPAQQNSGKILENNPVSRQYYHPRFFQYLTKRWFKGVR